MSNVSYSLHKNAVLVIERDLSSEWDRQKELQDTMDDALVSYEKLLTNLRYAQLNLAVMNQNITNSQDKINDLSVKRDDMLVDREVDISDDEDGYESEEMDEIFVCVPRERKTIKNVLTVVDAIKSGKSSKNHKMRVRSHKGDRTKSFEAKTHSKRVKASHMV